MELHTGKIMKHAPARGITQVNAYVRVKRGLVRRVCVVGRAIRLPGTTAFLRPTTVDFSMHVQLRDVV
jgi:hypothetical protein